VASAVKGCLIGLMLGLALWLLGIGLVLLVAAQIVH
jgi:hypothetical protein